MTYSDGWAALNLEMPARVPHTEYSVREHWDVVRRVTGMDVHAHSPEALRKKASKALAVAWNYDIFWSTLVAGEELSALHTDMGHAEYADEGVDRRDTVFCPFQSPEEVLALDFDAVYGRVDLADWKRRFEEHYREQSAWLPDGVHMTGVYTTLISGLIDILGWDMLLMTAGVDPQGFGQVANRYAAWNQQFFDALAAADVPVVMIHDDIVWSSGAFINPRWYREFVFPNYKKYIAPLRDSGKKILFTSDGNYTRFIDDIAACGVHGFVMEPTTDMAYIAEKYGKTHAFIGNADTRILLSGIKADIRAEVERCMTIGKPCPGFFLAVGNHIPANTPTENVLYYQEVYEELSRR